MPFVCGPNAPTAFALETLGRIIQRNRQAIDSGDPFMRPPYGTSASMNLLWQRPATTVCRASMSSFTTSSCALSPVPPRQTLSERSCQEHKAICEQLAAGDAAAAEQAVRRHYASLRQYYVHLLISKDYRA